MDDTLTHDMVLRFEAIEARLDALEEKPGGPKDEPEVEPYEEEQTDDVEYEES